MSKMYKIETLINDNWTDDGVGGPNEFETKRAAAEMIPALAKTFGCRKDEFRVKLRESKKTN